MSLKSFRFYELRLGCRTEETGASISLDTSLTKLPSLSVHLHSSFFSTLHVPIFRFSLFIQSPNNFVMQIAIPPKSGHQLFLFPLMLLFLGHQGTLTPATSYARCAVIAQLFGSCGSFGLWGKFSDPTAAPARSYL